MFFSLVTYARNASVSDFVVTSAAQAPVALLEYSLVVAESTMQAPSLADFAHPGVGQMAAYVKARSQHDYQARRKRKRAELRDANQVAAEHRLELTLPDVGQRCTSNVVASYIIKTRREQVTCV